MKIAFFLENKLTVFGGLEKVLTNLITFLKEQNHEIIIYNFCKTDNSLPEKEAWVEPFRSNQTFIIEYRLYPGLLGKIQRWTGRHKILSSAEKNIYILKGIRDIEIAIVTDPFLLIPVSNLLIKSNIKAKLVGWFHNSLYAAKSMLRIKVKKLFPPVILKKHLMKAHAFLAISSGIAKQIKNIVPKKDVFVVHNPVLYENAKNNTIKRPDDIILAYVGRIEDKQKNLRFLFEALSSLKIDWNLKIIGDGPSINVLKKYATKLGIEPKVKWLGFLNNPFDELKKEGVTVLLLTSRFEGLPTVLIEAISYGIPVLSSNCETGPEDIVIPGLNGYLYNQGSKKNFISKLTGIIENKVLIASPEKI